MASIFDELLIETPIANPNNVRSNFSPTESSARYKYQALKDFRFMLQMEPFIGLGLINLIPDPSEFDLPLMKAVMEMAKDRNNKKEILVESDTHLYSRMFTDDLLNSTAIMPRDARIQLIISELGLDESTATQTVTKLESSAETSPLVILQKVNSENSGQIINFRMGPNYEMALFIAQVTGSILVTDSNSRWQELMSAQHRNQGITTSPWSKALDKFDAMPIDGKFLDTYRRSQNHFDKIKNLLKKADRMIQNNNYNSVQLSELADQVSVFSKQLKQTSDPLRVERLRISSPLGGFYDTNVQRLLTRSSCLRYDQQVRSVYGIGLDQ